MHNCRFQNHIFPFFVNLQWHIHTILCGLVLRISLQILSELVAEILYSKPDLCELTLRQHVQTLHDKYVIHI